MKALRFDSDETTYVKALIYGKPGTGKTTMGVSAPKPLILLSERQGMTHILQAAREFGHRPIGVLFMSDLADYRAVLRTLILATRNPAMRSGPFIVKGSEGETLFESDEWPETIVLDSVTDACRLVDAQIMAESPPKLGKDNLPVNSERYWSVLRDRCEKLIRGFRDIDFHVLYLCLEDDRTIGEGEEAERKVGPALPMRSLPDTIAAAVNVVGVMSRRIQRGEGEAKIDYIVRTVGPQWYLLKPFRPLRDTEVPNFSEWIRRITNPEAIPVPEFLSDEASPSVSPDKTPPVPKVRPRSRPRSAVATPLKTSDDKKVSDDNV